MSGISGNMAAVSRTKTRGGRVIGYQGEATWQTKESGFTTSSVVLKISMAQFIQPWESSIKRILRRKSTVYSASSRPVPEAISLIGVVVGAGMQYPLPSVDTK